MTTLDPKADLISRLRKGHEAITPAPSARYYHVPPTALELEAADFLSALPAQPVAVKPLEWAEAEESERGIWLWKAGDYGINKLDWGEFSTYDVARGHWLAAGPFKTLEQAKAAAQADYEQRINAALTAPSQQEGVTEREPCTKFIADPCGSSRCASCGKRRAEHPVALVDRDRVK